MKLSELLNNGLIEKIPVSIDKARHSISITKSLRLPHLKRCGLFGTLGCSKFNSILKDGVFSKNFDISKRDLDTAEHLLDKQDFDWCFSVAYNAMLQVGRSIMWINGYRPKGSSSHISIIEFVKALNLDDMSMHTFLLNKMRQKRHLLVYEEAGVISKGEAESALKQARSFIDKIKKVLKI
ncbi:MAG: HEPN domain-containing protein [Nanoarchaeota archaeon]